VSQFQYNNFDFSIYRFILKKKTEDDFQRKMDLGLKCYLFSNLILSFFVILEGVLGLKWG
jgi:hypothetical protein